jgi:integrase
VNVSEFVNGEYFAHARASLAVSTIDGYRKMWRKFEPYFEGRGLDLRVFDCQGIMRQICIDNPHLNRTSLGHAKNFFSGIWSHALRMGVIERDNPWKTAEVPNAPEPGETHAYSAAEVEAMLRALPEPYDLMVLFAACTGLRKSEMRGCQWRDFNAEARTLSVERAVWRTTVKTTKNKSSKAPIPVIAVLADRLTKFRKKAPVGAFIFGGESPIDLDNLTRRKIIPTLRAAGIAWRGWHAFRRGLATTMHAAGVQDKEIQRVLRHGDIATTQKSYVKVMPESVRLAMGAVSFGLVPEVTRT